MKNLFLSLAIISFLLSPAYAKDAKAYMSQVKRVIDGDTLELKNGEQVELIGIDCPEADTEEGKMVLECVDTYIKQGQSIRLEFDVQHKDDHGRLLAYVYVLYSMNDGNWLPPQSVHPGVWSIVKENALNDWEMFLNAYIIQQGLALPLTAPPNVKYADLFQELYQDARKNKKGLWKESESVAICPQCGAHDVVEIVYGLPTDKLTEAAQRGEVVLGGCIVTDNDPRWACKSCNHKW